MKNKVWLRLLLTVLLFGCSCCLWIKLGSMFLADIYSARSESSLENLDFNSSIKYADKAISLNPMEPAYFRRRAKIFLISPTGGNKFQKELALKDIHIAIDLNSRNLATLRNSIPLFAYLSLQEPISQDFSLTDEVYLDLTREFYVFLSESYSNDVGIAVSVANYQKKLGLKSELDRTLHRIKLLRPDLLEWHPDLID